MGVEGAERGRCVSVDWVASLGADGAPSAQEHHGHESGKAQSRSGPKGLRGELAQSVDGESRDQESAEEVERGLRHRGGPAEGKEVQARGQQGGTESKARAPSRQQGGAQSEGRVGREEMASQNADPDCPECEVVGREHQWRGHRGPCQAEDDGEPTIDSPQRQKQSNQGGGGQDGASQAEVQVPVAEAIGDSSASFTGSRYRPEQSQKTRPSGIG